MPPKKATKSGGLKAGHARAKSKDTVEVNLTGVTAGRRRRIRIPEGNYRAKLVEATAGKSKSDKDMVTWVFELTEGEYAGTRFWHRTVLTNEALWNYRRTLDALEVPIKEGTMSVRLSRLIGRTCGVEIVDDDGSYDGKVRSEINDLFTTKELEDEEPDGDEEEDEDEYDDEDEDEDEEDAEEEYDDEDEAEEEDSDEWEDSGEEEDEDEVDLASMNLTELKELASDLGVSVKPPKGATRLSTKVLRERIEAYYDTDEDDDELELEEEDL